MDEAAISDVIALAWADDVSFEAIEVSTGLTEPEVIAIMRRHLKPSSFRLWRARVSGRQAKHARRRSAVSMAKTKKAPPQDASEL